MAERLGILSESTDYGILNVYEVDTASALVEAKLEVLAAYYGFTPDDAKRMTDNSLGIYSFYELFKGVIENSDDVGVQRLINTVEQGTDIPVIGIDAIGDDYELVVSTLAASHYKKIHKHKDIKLDDPERASKYMDEVSKYPLVICVIPRQALAEYNGKQTETGKELAYYFDHDSSNVIYVIGDDVVNDNHPKLVGRESFERNQIQVGSLLEVTKAFNLQAA